MKKVLSIILVLAMLALPISVFAAGSGTGDDPYRLVNDAAALTITVPAETSVYLQADNTNGSTVNVVSASHTSYFFWYCRQTFNSATSLAMNPGVDMITLENTGTSPLTISLTLTGGSATELVGTFDNPESFEFAPNFFGNLAASLSAELDANNAGHYFTCLAPDDGVISVRIMGSVDADLENLGWTYFVNNITSGIYGTINYSDAEEPAIYEEIKVSKYDEIIIFASTYNPANINNNPAGTVSVDVSFAPIGSANAPAEASVGTHSVSLENQNQGYNYVWTATESGTATITMNTTDNWQYSVGVERTDDSVSYGDTHWSDDDPVVRSEDVAVNAGDKVRIWVATYNPNGFNNPEGNISWTLSFVDGEGNPIGGGSGDGGDGGDIIEDPDANFGLSDTAIQVGTAAYPIIPTYEYTVYEFAPTETGRYTFTSPDANVALVSNNGMWITVGSTTTAIEDGIVTEGTFQWDCTSEGQSIWVAAKLLDESANTAEITVTREELVIVEHEKRNYENTVTPEAFTFTGDATALLYVDTLDDNCDEAVLGDDGYYHLNSKNGPILLVDLNDEIMNLADAQSYGQLRETVYNGDEVDHIMDYNEAFGAYYACADEATGLYPLTADLITMYQKIGASKGWYGEDGWLGGLLDDAWMFACYYLEGASDIDDLGSETPGASGSGTNPTTGTNNNNTTENKTPVSSGATGDNVVMIVIIAAVAVIGVVALVVFRKKAKAN